MIADKVSEERKKVFKHSTSVSILFPIAQLAGVTHMREEYATLLRKKHKDEVITEKRRKAFAPESPVTPTTKYEDALRQFDPTLVDPLVPIVFFSRLVAKRG